MTITTHRTVEHTFSSGDQTVLQVQTIESENLIDGSNTWMMIADENNSVSIHSRDQLLRLIANLQWVADHVLEGNDQNWNK